MWETRELWLSFGAITAFVSPTEAQVVRPTTRVAIDHKREAKVDEAQYFLFSI